MTRRRGFSLLEVLLAIALITALLGAMFAFLWDMLQVRERMLLETGRARGAALLIDAVERDLLTCVVGDAARGSGVQGDATTLSIMSRGVPARLAGAGERGLVFADLERSRYRFTGSGLIEGLRGPVVRGDVDGFETMGGPVGRLRFRYHDGSAWRDDFDSLAEDRLPIAIEVAIWYAVEPANEEPGFVDDDIAFGEPVEFDAAEDEPEQLPDRVRVILVPDSGGEASDPDADEVDRP